MTFRIIKINSESMTLQKWFRKTAVVLKIVSKADYYMYCKSKLDTAPLLERRRVARS